MATPTDYSALLEDPSQLTQLQIVSPDREYQTSNVVVQDNNKDGLLSFLSENTRYNSSNSAAANTSGTGTNTSSY